MSPGAGIGGENGLVGRIKTAYQDRWVNLFRETDPIGGHYVSARNSESCRGHFDLGTRDTNPRPSTSAPGSQTSMPIGPTLLPFPPLRPRSSGDRAPVS